MNSYPHSKNMFSFLPGSDPSREVRKYFLTSFTLVNGFRWQAASWDPQFNSMRFKVYGNSSRVESFSMFGGVVDFLLLCFWWYCSMELLLAKCHFYISWFALFLPFFCKLDSSLWDPPCLCTKFPDFDHLCSRLPYSNFHTVYQISQT